MRRRDDSAYKNISWSGRSLDLRSTVFALMLLQFFVLASCLAAFAVAQNTTLTVDLGALLPLSVTLFLSSSMCTYIPGYATYQTDFSFETGVTSFLGIRYASPPLGISSIPPPSMVSNRQTVTGELRWRAPQPPDDVIGIQNATTMPNECIQAAFGLSSTNPFEPRSLTKRAATASEDCLFLKYVRS